ncbi:MAG: CinA family protein [Bauldia sp.]|nr:CinA family protein [Bauldia sp.]
MTDLSPLAAEAGALVERCRSRGFGIATAESCTGGLVAGAITEIPGSSAVFDRGFVTYANAAKTDLLGVPAELIDRVGAVSAEVALAMAEGALARSQAEIAVAVTGIAGPGGGSAGKPVGLVFFCATRRDRPPIAAVRQFGDIGRSAVRLAACHEALRLLMEQASIA